MKSEEKALELIEAASGQRKMSPAQQQQVWNKIEGRIRQSPSPSRAAPVRKWFRRVSPSVAVILMVLLLAGGSYGVLRHHFTTAGLSHNPIVEQLPEHEKQALLTMLGKASFKVELPKQVPFKIQHGHGIPGAPTGPYKVEIVQIFIGNPSQTLQIMEIGSKLSSSRSSVGIPNKNGSLVHLKNGSEAYFQKNSSFSRLSWSQDGIGIDLVSSKPDEANKQTGTMPGLTKSQLIHVAESFQ